MEDDRQQKVTGNVNRNLRNDPKPTNETKMSADEGGPPSILEALNAIEDTNYQRAVRSACWRAIQKVRDDRMRLWQEFLDSDDEKEDIPSEENFQQRWDEEIARSKQMLESLYYNLQRAKGTKLHKKVITLKDRKGKDLIEYTTVTMIRDLQADAAGKNPFEVTHLFEKGNMHTRFKLAEETLTQQTSDRVKTLEDKNSDNGNVMEDFRMPNDKITEGGQQQKPPISIVTKMREFASRKRKREERSPSQENEPLIKRIERQKTNNNFDSTDAEVEGLTTKAANPDESGLTPLAGVMRPAGPSPVLSTSSRSSRKIRRTNRAASDSISSQSSLDSGNTPGMGAGKLAEPQPGPSWRE